MKPKDILKEIAPVVLVTIAGTFVFAFAAFVVIEDRFPEALLDLWNTWDAQQYIKIAKYGYSSSTVDERNLLIVFFPLFPLLTSLFALVFQDYIVSALIVSNLAYGAAAYYLYKLVKIDFDSDDAYRAVMYFSIFSTAYFMHAVYTESLFLALTIASFYYARKENWALSGVIGMLAATTRITGILILPVLIIEYLSQREYKIRTIRKDVVWIGVIGLGLVSYLIINYIVYGDPFQFMVIQKEHWNKKLAFPYEGLIRAWELVSDKNPAESLLVSWVETVFAALGLVLIIISFFRVRLSYSLYALATWLVVTSTWFWLSIPRYTLSMFPIFIVLALLGRRKDVHFLITFISILFYALFLWTFVRFRWAF